MASGAGSGGIDTRRARGLGNANSLEGRRGLGMALPALQTVPSVRERALGRRDSPCMGMCTHVPVHVSCTCCVCMCLACARVMCMCV